jgi:ERCC4-type nuclease
VASVSILADVGERRSSVPDALGRLGADVTFEVLPAGDYVVGPTMLVERKTVGDLHRSVATRRLWAQLEKLRANADGA